MELIINAEEINNVMITVILNITGKEDNWLTKCRLVKITLMAHYSKNIVMSFISGLAWLNSIKLNLFHFGN